MQRSREQSVVSASQSDSELSEELRLQYHLPAVTPGKFVYMVEDDDV